MTEKAIDKVRRVFDDSMAATAGSVYVSSVIAQCSKAAALGLSSITVDVTALNTFAYPPRYAIVLQRALQYEGFTAFVSGHLVRVSGWDPVEPEGAD